LANRGKTGEGGRERRKKGETMPEIIKKQLKAGEKKVRK